MQVLCRASKLARETSKLVTFVQTTAGNRVEKKKKAKSKKKSRKKASRAGQLTSSA